VLTAVVAVLGVGLGALQLTGAGSDEQTLLDLEPVWNEAHVHGDVRVLENLWADDIVIIVPRMEPINKEDALAVLRAGPFKFESYESSSATARIQSDVGIVTGRLTRVRRIGERRIQDKWRFTKVYVRNGASWRVVSFHASDAGE